MLSRRLVQVLCLIYLYGYFRRLTVKGIVIFLAQPISGQDKMRLFSSRDAEKQETTADQNPSNMLQQPEIAHKQTPEVADGPASRKQGLSKNPRPTKPSLTRTTTAQTRYMEMLLGLDTIPRIHNLLASFFTWILLAGFLVFPGTFTSLQNYESSNKSGPAIEHKILHTVANVPLLWVAGACVIIGALGMVGLWFRWRRNYVWLINRIFM